MKVAADLVSVENSLPGLSISCGPAVCSHTVCAGGGYVV